ncbi:MAG: hypothetical protein PV344_03010 [Anaplasma sp.]|nr:hypothetical protein [Anaplasma sp.]
MERDSVMGPRSHRLLIRSSCCWVTQRPTSLEIAPPVPKLASMPSVA